MEIKNMTGKQLRERQKELANSSKEVTEALENIKAEQLRRKQLKENYALVVNEPTYTYHNERAFSAALKLADESPITKETLLELSERFKTEDYIPNGNIYPCPECGEMRLAVGDYGDSGRSHKHHVHCEWCDFVCPKGLSDYGEAWVVFVEWLYKKGYLKHENEKE